MDLHLKLSEKEFYTIVYAIDAIIDKYDKEETKAHLSKNKEDYMRYNEQLAYAEQARMHILEAAELDDPWENENDCRNN